MKRLFLYILLTALCLPLFAAKDIVRVAATYEYISDNARETPEQAERTAIERAKQKALEEKFGVDVSAVTNTLITNRNGSDAQSQTNVFSLGGTSVRGAKSARKDVCTGFLASRSTYRRQATQYRRRKSRYPLYLCQRRPRSRIAHYFP